MFYKESEGHKHYNIRMYLLILKNVLHQKAHLYMGKMKRNPTQIIRPSKSVQTEAGLVIRQQVQSSNRIKLKTSDEGK